MKKKTIGTAYVGIDVHKNNWKVCLLGELGFRKEFSCEPESKVLFKSLIKLLPDFYFECAYEAGFSGFWLYDELNEMENVNCIIVNPADIPTSDKEKSQKEDRRDARKIASQLKAGGLKGIYVPNSSDLGLREIQRTRFTVVKDLTRSKVRVKSFLMRHGITPPKKLFPSSKSHWSARFIKWLKEIKLSSSTLRYSLDQLIAKVEFNRQMNLNVLKELRKQLSNGAKSKQYEVLSEVRGLGTVGCSTIITEVVDIKRFSSYQQFHSYIGLIPSTNNSDTTERIRGITNRSNKRLRSVFIEAAWIAIRYNEELFHYYHELKRRMNANKAIIRVAKKIASQVRYLLLNLESEHSGIGQPA